MNLDIVGLAVTRPRRVKYTGDFETPFQGDSQARNGGYITTLTNVGADACTGNVNKLKNYNADSIYNLRIEDSETIFGSTITPRKGKGFMFQVLDVDLQYGMTCANSSTVNDKPRVALSWNQEMYPDLLPWDEAILYSVSIFIPKDIEAENCGEDNLAFRETAIGEFGNKHICGSCQNWSKIFRIETVLSGIVSLGGNHYLGS